MLFYGHLEMAYFFSLLSTKCTARHKETEANPYCANETCFLFFLKFQCFLGCLDKTPNPASLSVPVNSDKGFGGPGKKRCINITPLGAW